MYIYAMLPIFASAKFKCKKPEKWENMSLNEKKEYFLQIAENLGSPICHHCADNLQIDGELNYTEYYKSFNEEDFWEE